MDLYPEFFSTDYMAETGDAGRLPTSLDVLASDVHSRLEFHRYAFMDCVGIKNALHCVIEERENLQQRQNGKCCCVLLKIFIYFALNSARLDQKSVVFGIVTS